jgi:hypothetical protein
MHPAPAAIKKTRIGHLAITGVMGAEQGCFAKEQQSAANESSRPKNA